MRPPQPQPSCQRGRCAERHLPHSQSYSARPQVFGLRGRRPVPAITPIARRAESQSLLLVDGRNQSSDRNQTERKGSGRQWEPTQATGRPITACQWLEQASRPIGAWAVVAAERITSRSSTAVTSNPTGCIGVADFLGMNWRSPRGSPDCLRSRMPGAARQLHGDAALLLCQRRATRRSGSTR